jgi:5'-3' exoribonuclease 4
MGIPSYYKRLIDRFPRLVQKGAALSSDVLLMDFNCLIYQCIRGEGLPRYTNASRLDWEAAVIEAVKNYTVKVWGEAGKPGKVFIAVDGVVPMAKIRQQRLRRFKSRWLAAAEAEAGVRKPGEESWDTNAITPGTQFMESLALGLRSLVAARPGWTLSAADEAGEGEQKLMAWVRTHRAELAAKQVVVYGLDADLIVLSLIGAAREVPGVGGWRLLRELTEFEGRRAGESFGALDILELLRILCPKGIPAEEYILDYACGMSFLGNDFLPHSLSVKMREGGHDILCRSLTAVHATGLRLVRDGKVQRDGCLDLVRRWVADEEANIREGFDQKYKMRPMPPKTDRERLMMHVENLPIEWAAESALWDRHRGMAPGWHEVYRREWLQEGDVGAICSEYARGLQWILDYYLGKGVSYTWYFPWNLPPLWVDLEQEFLRADAVMAPAVSSPVAPQEQLAMVLPMDSWWLVRDTRLRCLPGKAPIFWPASFGFFSVGRRWLWECEALVPILTAERMREIR